MFTSTPAILKSIQRSLTATMLYPSTSNHLVTTGRARVEVSQRRLPDVSNTVVFGEGNGRLRITALASTSKRKLVEPRVGDGTIFGFSPFGKSFSASQPRRPSERIDFAFQEALFEFVKPVRFTIPYPVPFKLLGDEAKGFIDNTLFHLDLLVCASKRKLSNLILQKADVNSDKKAGCRAKSLPSNSEQEGRTKKEAAILFIATEQKFDYDQFQKDLVDAV